MIREYLRIKKLSLYVKGLFYKYKLEEMKETLGKMKNNLKELRWLHVRKTYRNWTTDSKTRGYN